MFSNKYLPSQILTKQQLLNIERLLEEEKISAGIMNKYQIIPQHIEVDLFRAKNVTYYMPDPANLG